MNSVISLFERRLFYGSHLKSIVIPSKVREIGEGCFAGSLLSRVEFPVNGCLIVIRKSAFESTSLKTLHLPKTVKCLGDFCFARTRKLKTVDFCKGCDLKRIGAYCFKGCSLSHIEVPAGVKQIGYGSFSGLDNIFIDGQNPYLTSNGLFLLCRNQRGVCGLLMHLRHLKLPAVDSVMKYSFRKCQVQSLFVPKAIRRIGVGAFEESEKLEEVIFEPGSLVLSIGARCFASCTKLQRLSMDNMPSLKTLSQQCFNRTGLASVCVPCFVRTIDTECFSGCSNLSSITFAPGSCLRRICDLAFYGSALASFEAPPSLVALGNGVFSLCSELASVVFPLKSAIQFIGDKCFSVPGNKMKHIELPDTISIIKGDAFNSDCDVRIRSDDSEISEMFEHWLSERSDEPFINPKSEEATFMMGALRLCEHGVIGKGGQGSVKLKENMITGQLLAVKTINFGNLITEERWQVLKQREIELLEMQCPCLVEVRKMFFDDSRHRMTIGMEYVAGPCSLSSSSPKEQGLSKRSASVSLKDVLEKPPLWWTNTTKAITILGIAHAIDYLHDRGVTHRDLKPSNVLFDEKMRPKVCDFDAARIESDDSSADKTIIGTPLYMAPEIGSGNYNDKVDFYSFGCIVYEIFERRNFVQSLLALKGGCQFTDNTPSGMHKIIKSCLCEDADYRCDFLDSDFPSLLSALADAVRTNMGLDENELAAVEDYLREIECDEDGDEDDYDDD